MLIASFSLLDVELRLPEPLEVVRAMDKACAHKTQVPDCGWTAPG